MKTSMILLAALTLSQTSIAESPIPFKEVWQRVKQHSPDLSVAAHERKAAEIDHATAAKHWYPHVYAEGRGYGTNDPALTFMSVLGQRQIATNDFSPDSLNHPSSQLFARGTLGVDMPLYQGGAASAQEEASARVTEAKTWEEKSQELLQYSDVAASYAELLVLMKQRAQIEMLISSVEELMKKYELGAEGNPVGYSGLLGMKSLRNRLLGLKEQNQSREQALKNKMTVMGAEFSSGWTPETEEPTAFVEKWLPKVETSPNVSPFFVKAAVSGAEASEKRIDAERAKLLPQVGLFAEGYVLTGSRDTGTSYAGGAYLKWDLFSAPSWGALDTAHESAAAAKAKAESLKQKAAIVRAESLGAEEGLKRNLQLLSESTSLLEEQVKTSRKLFQNGSINALQLVEVLSRRADLISQQSEVELGLAKTRAQSLYFAGNKMPLGVEP